MDDTNGETFDGLLERARAARRGIVEWSRMRELHVFGIRCAVERGERPDYSRARSMHGEVMARSREADRLEARALLVGDPKRSTDAIAHATIVAGVAVAECSGLKVTFLRTARGPSFDEGEVVRLDLNGVLPEHRLECLAGRWSMWRNYSQDQSLLPSNAIPAYRDGETPREVLELVLGGS